jgi:ribosomal protein RSM22 (predicted rRNA methylase)
MKCEKRETMNDLQQQVPKTDHQKRNLHTIEKSMRTPSQSHSQNRTSDNFLHAFSKSAQLMHIKSLITDNYPQVRTVCIEIDSNYKCQKIFLKS